MTSPAELYRLMFGDEKPGASTCSPVCRCNRCLTERGTLLRERQRALWAREGLNPDAEEKLDQERYRAWLVRMRDKAVADGKQPPRWIERFLNGR